MKRANSGVKEVGEVDKLKSPNKKKFFKDKDFEIVIRSLVKMVAEQCLNLLENNCTLIVSLEGIKMTLFRDSKMVGITFILTEHSSLFINSHKQKISIRE